MHMILRCDNGKIGHFGLVGDLPPIGEDPIRGQAVQLRCVLEAIGDA